jgi:predicted negative regulator of RcsB-dependent stress response
MLHTIRRIRQGWHKMTHRQRKNGVIAIAFMVGLLGITWGIFQYIDHMGWRAARNASVEYSDLMEQMLEKNKDPAVMHRAEQLVHRYPKTVYANMMRLMLAGEAYRNNHAAAAKAYLEEVLKSKKGTPLAHIARLRLARLLANEQQYTESLALLNAAHAKGFEPLYHTAAGDIYLIMQDIEKANEAYLLAMQALPEDASDTWLRIKQADIGGQG